MWLIYHYRCMFLEIAQCTCNKMWQPQEVYFTFMAKVTISIKGPSDRSTCIQLHPLQNSCTNLYLVYTSLLTIFFNVS